MKKKALILIISILSGCSSTNMSDKNENSLDLIVDKEIESRNLRTSNFSIFDNSYYSVYENNNDSKNKDIPVSFYSVEPMTIYEVLDIIELQFKMPYYMSDILSLTEEEKKLYNDRKKITFDGSLDNFFKYLGKVYGLDIVVDDFDALKVSYFQTKMYSLDQFIDGNKSSASLSVGSGATSGGFSASSESSVESDTWEKIENYLDDVVGENGSSTILEDFSLVKITARPWIISEVDQLFDRLKAESQMQVSVQYRIISLSKSKLSQLAAKFGLDSKGNDFTITSELVDSVALNAAGGGLSFAKRSVSGRLDAVVKYLAQDVVSEGHFVGLPNRIMPINLTTTSSYISEVEKVDNENVDKSTTSLKTSEIKTGLSMLILPKVLEDGRIQLTSGFTKKQLIAMDTVSGVQLPTVDENETLSTVTLDSGDVELITLYKGNSNNSAQAAQLLGLGQTSSEDDQVIAVLIGADSYKLASSVSKRGLYDNR
ncbi:toxin coregulated pilus outer membrane protein TcpC [Aliivibrio fischeri ES114]|uniref:Toxin coregulated pilus outer membrane protein TcpC n=1 Tax=Aliivibrio fischeri (strain ATCC 700601 / ES114) TaxID=312309 RepID=Q5DZ54_ALIF1|nr:toxin-coregulated pilus secretin TcpC [Aliivibrio fischeri]AAW87942.1 toxin coregulated pilus outer membrane protein TcpC [Aliivibrio fischeri ES114]KLU80427.1 pilus assembly protein [Aliivibrio fischeri]